MPGSRILAGGTGVIVVHVVPVGSTIVPIVELALGFGCAPAFVFVVEFLLELVQFLAEVVVLLVAIVGHGIHGGVTQVRGRIKRMISMHVVSWVHGLERRCCWWWLEVRGWLLLHHEVHLGRELLDGLLAFMLHAFKSGPLLSKDLVGCLVGGGGIRSGILFGNDVGRCKVPFEVGPRFVCGVGANLGLPFFAGDVEVPSAAKVAQGHPDEVVVGDVLTTLGGENLAVLEALEVDG